MAGKKEMDTDLIVFHVLMPKTGKGERGCMQWVFAEEEGKRPDLWGGKIGGLRPAAPCRPALGLGVDIISFRWR